MSAPRRRAVVGVGWLLMTACSNGIDDDRVTYLIVQQPAIGMLDAPMDATVSISGDCPLLVDGGVRRAIWPAGTSFDPEADLITLADGRQVRDGDRITGGGGSEIFGGNLDAYGDVLVGDSLTAFSTTCRDDETETTEWFLIAPGSITVSTP